MIQISAHTPFFIALDPIDFRCGIDKLATISENVSGMSSKTGALFVFRNTKGNSFKLLVFDGTGFWICQKRLSQGRLKFWPKTEEEAALSAEAVLLLLRGEDPRGLSPPWVKIRTILDEEKERKHRHRLEQRRASGSQAQAREQDALRS